MRVFAVALVVFAGCSKGKNKQDVAPKVVSDPVSEESLKPLDDKECRQLLVDRVVEEDMAPHEVDGLVVEARLLGKDLDKRDAENLYGHGIKFSDISIRQLSHSDKTVFCELSAKWQVSKDEFGLASEDDEEDYDDEESFEEPLAGTLSASALISRSEYRAVLGFEAEWYGVATSELIELPNGRNAMVRRTTHVPGADEEPQDESLSYGSFEIMSDSVAASDLNGEVEFIYSYCTDIKVTFGEGNKNFEVIAAGAKHTCDWDSEVDGYQCPDAVYDEALGCKEQNDADE